MRPEVIAVDVGCFQIISLSRRPQQMHGAKKKVIGTKAKEGAKRPNRHTSLELQRTRKKQAHQGRILAERLKELNCLYSISKIFDKKGLTLDGAIRRTIQVVPTAWQYPSIAGARVVLNGKDFQTKRFRSSEWMQECPIIVQGASVGSIAVGYCEKRPEQDEGPFLKEERNLLNVIAQRLGDVIERKRSEQKLLRYQEELRSLATELALSEEQERRRIAQALHDRIGQVLALINIKVGALLESADSEDLVKALRDIRGLVSESVTETRSLTFDLSPPILYELGFEAALEWLAERIQQQYGVEVEIRGCEKKISLGIEWRVTLFAAVRELLVNVGKHAISPIARVTMKKRQGNIVISVKDEGVGMDPSTRASVKPGTNGFGLFSIRERLGFMGGRVEISSKRGQGTCVTLFVPVEKLKRVQERR
jgi:two-component system NarL family sensor kinase